jgi:hypothetical protein
LTRLRFIAASLNRDWIDPTARQLAGISLMGSVPEFGIGVARKQGVERNRGEGQITGKALGGLVFDTRYFTIPARMDDKEADPLAHTDFNEGAVGTHQQDNVAREACLDGYSLCHDRLLESKEPGHALRKARLFYFSSAAPSTMSKATAIQRLMDQAL